MMNAFIWATVGVSALCIVGLLWNNFFRRF